AGRRAAPEAAAAAAAPSEVRPDRLHLTTPASGCSWWHLDTLRRGKPRENKGFFASSSLDPPQALGVVQAGPQGVGCLPVPAAQRQEPADEVVGVGALPAGRQRLDRLVQLPGVRGGVLPPRQAVAEQPRQLPEGPRPAGQVLPGRVADLLLTQGV